MSELPDGTPLSAEWEKHTTSLERRTLGLRPYVLVEARSQDLSGDHDVRMTVSYGGGVTDYEDAAGMLAVTLTKIPGGIEYMRKVIEELDE